LLILARVTIRYKRAHICCGTQCTAADNVKQIHVCMQCETFIHMSRVKLDLIIYELCTTEWCEEWSRDCRNCKMWIGKWRACSWACLVESLQYSV